MILKILKSNIFIFFVFGVILSITLLYNTNWDNYYGPDAEYHILLDIELLLYYYIPFFAALVLNLIIKFIKNEKAKKVFNVIMIITNILSVIYLSGIAFLEYVGATAFDY